MECEMRPEFERGKGTGQWHGGPIAAVIDTVGDYALIMALRRGPADHQLPRRLSAAAIKTKLITTATVRRNGKSVGIVDVDVFNDKMVLLAIAVRPIRRCRLRPHGMKFASSDVGLGNGGCHDDQGFTPRVWRGRLRRRLVGTSGGSFHRAREARRHPGGDVGRRRAAGLLRAGRGGSEPDLLSVEALRAAAKRNMDGTFEGVLAESWKPSADFKSYTVKFARALSSMTART